MEFLCVYDERGIVVKHLAIVIPTSSLLEICSFCHYSQFFFGFVGDLSVEDPEGCEIAVIARAYNTRFSTPEKRNIDRKWEKLSSWFFFYGMESRKYSVNGLNLKLAVHWFFFYSFFALASQSAEKKAFKPNGLKFIRRRIGNWRDFPLHIYKHIAELFPKRDFSITDY
jgi:hypothetical protein